jgi:hypothetical protein
LWEKTDVISVQNLPSMRPDQLTRKFFTMKPGLMVSDNIQSTKTRMLIFMMVKTTVGLLSNLELIIPQS